MIGLPRTHLPKRSLTPRDRTHHFRINLHEIYTRNHQPSCILIVPLYTYTQSDPFHIFMHAHHHPLDDSALSTNGITCHKGMARSSGGRKEIHNRQFFCFYRPQVIVTQMVCFNMATSNYASKKRSDRNHML